MSRKTYQMWVGAVLACVGIATPVWSKPASQLISMRFVDTDLRVIFRALADKVGFDLVIAPGIEADVDVDLDDVAWETALDALASSHDLSYYWRDDLLTILPGGELGDAHLTHQVVPLRYANPVAVQAVLTKLLVPPAKAELMQTGALAVGQSVGSNVPPLLIISETPQAMGAILALIDSLDVARPQFEIGVKFVETTLDDKWGVGFKWPTRVTASLVPDGGSDDEGDEVSGRGPAEYDFDNSGRWTFGTLSVDELTGFLELLNQKGKSKLLSDPRVSVVESERAVMRVATTIPVQTLNRFSEGGTIQDIVSFQDLDVGITLAVTPRLNENDLITLDVEPIVEEITGFTGPADNQRPITSKRMVRTTVRVKNEETVIIGGLVRETDFATNSKLFLLGDIPILGALFTHEKIEKQKTDLLIFITPRIVDPLAAN